MTKSTETTGGEGSVAVDGGVDGPEADEVGTDEPTADEEPRAVDFEMATEELGGVFEIDGRRGETITNLETTETDEGRQVVATVERSRSTMLSHRIEGVKRTGRRAGGGLAVLAAFIGLVYVVLTRRFDGDDLLDEGTSDD